MSDPSLGQDPPDPNESPNVRQMREHIKKLEAEAKEAADAKAEAATLRRQLVLRDAAVTLSEFQMQALEHVYTGEWTAEGVRDAVTKLGIVPSLQPPPPPAVSPEEMAAHQRMSANAASGSSAAPAPNSPAEREARIRQFKGTEAEFDAFLREMSVPIGTIGGPPESGGIQQL